MLAELSWTDTLPRFTAIARPERRSYGVSMICLAYVSLLHILLCIGAMAIAFRTFGVAWAVVAALATLYLLPPMAVAMARPLCKAQGRTLSDRFAGVSIRWWYTAQVGKWCLSRFSSTRRVASNGARPVFNPNWLRLWGAKIGSIVYWSPGLRGCLIGHLLTSETVWLLALGARLSPHFLARLTKTGMDRTDVGHHHDRRRCDDRRLFVAAGWCVGWRLRTKRLRGGRPISFCQSFSRMGNPWHDSISIRIQSMKNRSLVLLLVLGTLICAASEVHADEAADSIAAFAGNG